MPRKCTNKKGAHLPQQCFLEPKNRKAGIPLLFGLPEISAVMHSNERPIFHRDGDMDTFLTKLAELAVGSVLTAGIAFFLLVLLI